MKIRNPFRTKRIIIAMPDKTVHIFVPFIGKTRMESHKVEMRGYSADVVIVDELGYLNGKT
jgi:hypothetical protein